MTFANGASEMASAERLRLRFTDRARCSCSTYALPSDNDRGSFRPLEALQHAIAIHCELETLARAYITDPIRKCRALDVIPA
jgi:hypothetical protein